MFKAFFSRMIHRKSDGAIIQKEKFLLKKISPNAVVVLKKLQKAGYQAYLVGGGVRDVLLNRQPKDFDVVTNASLRSVKKLFRYSRLIGKRFRLVHIYFPGEIIEVSTLQSALSDADTEVSEEDFSQESVVTIEEDAWRRDFTVNALYYDISNKSVIDFTGGLRDLKKGVIRMIGNPSQRYHEDPLRLLRAIRLSAKLNFSIEETTREPLRKLCSLLHHVPSARLLGEVEKLFFKGHAWASYQALMSFGYIHLLFPYTTAVLTGNTEHYARLIQLAMQATDNRFAANQSLNPGFLIGVLLWPVVQKKLIEHRDKEMPFFSILHHGIQETLQAQREAFPISARLHIFIRSVWLLQYHLERRRKFRIFRILNQRYFRGAYDFLQLRVKAGEPLQDILEWWTLMQTADPVERNALLDALGDMK